MYGNGIDEDVATALIQLFEKPESNIGLAWYVDNHDDGELIHAKIYELGDKFQVDGLCDLALERALGDRTLTFDVKSRRDAVKYLMDGRINERDEKSSYMESLMHCRMI